MKYMELKTLVWVGGLVQLGIVLAALWVPRVLHWRELLAPLHPFMRRLLWVYASFIMFVNLGFAGLSLRHAEALASGAPLARMVCGFIAVYWFARVMVQFFVFDIRPLVRSPFIRSGYQALTAGFIFLAAVYGAAALLPAG